MRNCLVTGATRLIGIVGDPIAQARSPEVYNAHLARRGAGAILLPFHVPHDRFDAVMPGLMQMANLAGLVFTVPFKERALALVDQVLPAGRHGGAINAARREPTGRWTGSMFDGTGLVRALLHLGASPLGCRILLLGAGGAGRAIALALAEAGAAAIAIVDPDIARAEALETLVRRHHPGCKAEARSRVEAAGFAIVVNASPIGMRPGDGLPARIGDLDPSCVVFDIIPKPDVTPLMALAATAGCRVGGGKLMIDQQADAVLDFLGFGDRPDEDQPA